MDEKYFAQKIEQKWQKRWKDVGTFETEVDAAREKFYCLEMLPYPSGRLHMGHVRNYSIGDALAWYKRLQGFNVLHPIGWDSFGQPAEQAAIKKGVNPRAWTEDNINQMREQLQRLGFGYDWRREIAAHRPEYYKFDQWFFLKMYEMGLAYKKMTKVNWCPRDQTTLSNEQASGGVCWRCGTAVEKKDLAQWFLRITSYAEELLAGMPEIEAGWAERVLTMQKNWIGRSEGAYVEFKVQSSKFKVEESEQKVRIFTTRIDTIYGANAIVVAASHPIIEKNFDNLADEVKAKIEEIKIELAKPTDYGEEVEKDGVDTGLKAINPFSNEELPVWVGNYVMMEYGTGAVMSVPAHDERDFEFAKKFDLTVKQVICPDERNSTKDNRNSTKDKQISSKDERISSKDKHIHRQDAQNLSRDERNLRDVEQNINPIAENISHVANNIVQVEEGNSQEIPNVEIESNNLPLTEYGVLINSGEWSGKTSEDAMREMAKFAGENNFGEATVTYRLRDWGISRQRFWGAPIPIIYCESCGTVPVSYDELPVKLPESAPFTGVGESPLAKVPEFVNVKCPNCSEPAKRETDTMDTFVDSTWYYFRYTDPKNENLPFDPEIAAYWMPVEQYIGGVDHAVMHLLYTRFWSKVMRDMGLVNFDEPIKNLLTQGMVVGESYYSEERASYVPQDEVRIERDERGKVTSAALISDGSTIKVAVEKMSKSKYNGVDPDDMVLIYGADAVRIFALFAAPAENELVWQETGIDGAVRFLQRVYRFVYRWHDALSGQPEEFIGEISGQAKKLRQKTHQTIKRVTNGLESYQFNTPVAALMELSNTIMLFKLKPETAHGSDIYALREALESLILMLAPYAPHMAEELWEILTGNSEGILASGARFPVADENLALADELEIPVQVNGKLRTRILVSPEVTNEELQERALSLAKIIEYIDGKEIIKVIIVPKRLVNIVVKG
jgi:leucyl-tRNA synthetase